MTILRAMISPRTACIRMWSTDHPNVVKVVKRVCEHGKVIGASPFYEVVYNSPSRIRTYDLAVNSRSLYQLSYRGLSCGRYEPHTRPTLYAHPCKSSPT